MNREKNIILFCLKMWRIVWRNDQASTVINTQLMNVEKCFVYISSCSVKKKKNHWCARSPQVGGHTFANRSAFGYSHRTQKIYALCHSAVLCRAVLSDVMLCKSWNSSRTHSNTLAGICSGTLGDRVPLYRLSRWWNVCVDGETRTAIIHSIRF